MRPLPVAFGQDAMPDVYVGGGRRQCSHGVHQDIRIVRSDGIGGNRRLLLAVPLDQAGQVRLAACAGRPQPGAVCVVALSASDVGRPRLSCLRRRVHQCCHPLALAGGQGHPTFDDQQQIPAATIAEALTHHRR